MLSCTSGLEGAHLAHPGRGAGYRAFLKLPRGAVRDPALAPFLHGSGGKVLRLQGAVTAME
jgi:hypothetical protein